MLKHPLKIETNDAPIEPIIYSFRASATHAGYMLPVGERQFPITTHQLELRDTYKLPYLPPMQLFNRDIHINVNGRHSCTGRIVHITVDGPASIPIIRFDLETWGDGSITRDLREMPMCDFVLCEMNDE
jgi:hypothetical protein